MMRPFTSFVLVAVLFLMSTAVFAAPENSFLDDTGVSMDMHVEDHKKGSSGMPQLNPDSFPTQIFWLIVTFSVLYFVFARRILPELSQIIETRREIIQDHLDKADSIKTKAEKVHSAYDEILNDAHEEATMMFSKVDDTIKNKTDSELKKMRDHVSAMVSQTEERIKRSRSEAMEKMDGIAAEIASQAAEKIVGISTDLDQARSVVQNLNSKKAA